MGVHMQAIFTGCIVSHLLAWQARSLAGEVCIRKHVGYRSFNVAIELFIKELRRKQKLRENSKALTNALLNITVKSPLNDHPKWLLLWCGWGGGGVGVVPMRVKLQESCTTRITFPDTSIFWRKCIEIGESICFSKFFSHSVQCTLYYIQRVQTTEHCHVRWLLRRSWKQ